jgi:hypothetical protein
VAQQILPKARGALYTFVYNAGWRQKSMRMRLLDIYVRSHLMQAAPVWGVALRTSFASTQPAFFRKLDACYKGAQRTLLQVDRAVRNEVVTALSGRPPLLVFTLKAVWRFYQKTMAGGKDRLVEHLWKWMDLQDNDMSRFSMYKGAAMVEQYPTIKSIYVDYVEHA